MVQNRPFCPLLDSPSRPLAHDPVFRWPQRCPNTRSTCACGRISGFDLAKPPTSALSSGGDGDLTAWTATGRPSDKATRASQAAIWNGIGPPLALQQGRYRAGRPSRGHDYRNVLTGASERSTEASNDDALHVSIQGCNPNRGNSNAGGPGSRLMGPAGSYYLSRMPISRYRSTEASSHRRRSSNK